VIDVAFLGTAVRPAATAVVIDVLRATSTITLALASGYKRVLVAGSIDEATSLRTPERTLAGAVGLRREGLEADIVFCARESVVAAVPRLAETVDGIAVIETAPTTRPTSAGAAGESTETHKR
jgi:phosphosulfolactate phosphohydrolase-like enzyme